MLRVQSYLIRVLRVLKGAQNTISTCNTRYACALQEDRSEVSLATSPGKGRTAFEIAAAIAPSASK